MKREIKQKIKLLNDIKSFNNTNYGFLHLIMGTYEGKHIITSKRILNKYKHRLSITSSKSYSKEKNLVGLSFVAKDDVINNLVKDTERYIEDKLSQLEV